jgi:hypothetical protein
MFFIKLDKNLIWANKIKDLDLLLRLIVLLNQIKE